MAQWGERFEFEGLSLIVSVSTLPFKDIAPDDLIDEVICLGSKDKKGKTEREEIVQRARKEIVGMKYKDFLIQLRPRVWVTEEHKNYFLSSSHTNDDTKVYCKDCCWSYTFTRQTGGMGGDCYHPDCFEKFDTPIAPSSRRINNSVEFNSNNNCSRFEKKKRSKDGAEGVQVNC